MVDANKADEQVVATDCPFGSARQISVIPERA
jgi:hypothetical protein